MSGTRSAYPGLPPSYEPRVHRAEVTAATRLTPGMVRVRLSGADMADYPTTGVGDEYVRLFFPDDPEGDVRMPFLVGRGWDYPEGVEPSTMRTYTIRRHEAGAVDIDFVVHEGGVAAQWALQARPGQQLALNPPISLYDRPPSAARQVLFTDEPGLPAALRIAESTAREIPTTIIGEVHGAAHELFADDRDVEHVWLRAAGNGRAPSQLLEAMRRVDIDADTYVWVAGETRVTRHARAHLRSERGVPGPHYKSVGYWTAGSEEWLARYESLGEPFHARLRAMWESDRDTEEISDEVAQLYEDAGL